MFIRLPQQFKACLVLLLLIYHSSIAQTTTEGSYVKSDFFSNFIPNTPTQSALGSFGNVPINYYTRLPEVNLNLLTLTSRDLNLPITINYDASGVRVDDIAGSVGLKWNLNAGGFIARSMNGLPDEYPNSGYWNFQDELNGSLGSVADWVTLSETGARDSEPDEFVILINGRSIKFYIKNGKPIILPNQNVSINYTVVTNKLNKFEVITEDGTKYIFGDNSNAIEERVVETMNVSVNYWYDYKQDTYDYSYWGAAKTGVLATFFLGNTQDIHWAEFSERTGSWYNSKWYLTQVISPGGDQINLSYIKSGNQKYVTQPFVSRIEPILNQVLGYTYTRSKCYSYDPFGCMGDRDFTITNTPEFKIPAYSIFKDACPDNDNICTNGFTVNVQNSQKEAYFEPVDYPVSPEGILINQALITESVIKISTITTSVGNRLEFVSSSRTDLPNGIKYDRIDLRDMNNNIIKSIGFTYSVSSAQKDAGDVMWLSEAFLMSRISNPLPSDYFDGHHAFEAMKYATTAFNLTTGATNPTNLNAGLIKYAYEGLKDYNYNRLYLDQITETTNGLSQFKYSFSYLSRSGLKRRITPVQTVLGFVSTSGQSPTSLPMQAGYKALYTNATDPVSGRYRTSGNARPGLLDKITYPTGGSTTFNWTGTFWSWLYLVQDKDANGDLIKQKELVATTEYTYTREVLVSYQNGELLPGKYRRYKVRTSSPQNRTFNFTHGVPVASKKIRVYDGISTGEYNGYEEYTYMVPDDIPTNIYASPKDKNALGADIDNMVTDVFPYPKKLEQDHLRGLLEEYTLFDKNGNPLKYQKNDYVVNPNGYQPLTIKGFNGGSFHNATKYRYGRYSIIGDWVVLSKTTDKIFSQVDYTKSISKITEYVYDNLNLQPIESITYNESAPQSKISTKTKYVTHLDYSNSINSENCQALLDNCLTDCADIVDATQKASCINTCRNQYQRDCDDSFTTQGIAIAELMNKHQISTPVEVQTISEESGQKKLISAIVYNYLKQGNPTIIKPQEIFGMKQSIDPTTFVSSNIDANGYFVKDSRTRLLHRFDTYDATTGNLLQQTTLDGIVSSYQWGYNNSLVSGFTINPGSTSITYLYDQKPLVGLNFSTDPNGRKSNYEYDNYWRLKLTKDHDGNILNRYRYNYAAQQNGFDDQLSVCCVLWTGQQLTFSSTDTNITTGTSTYSWDYGNGNKASSTTATNYTYTTAGTYTVTVKKENPEYPPRTVTKVITIITPPTVSICVDGPQRVDLCGVGGTYGSCTQAANRTPSSPTLLKATIVGSCSSPIYSWESQVGTGSWDVFGSGAQIEFGALGSVGSVNVRCRITNGCGAEIVSSTLVLSTYMSSANCPL